ncbi:Inositol-1-monophosphatase [Roseibium album]|nr:Inositol-1-monophosphatase [Roseibium album]
MFIREGLERHFPGEAIFGEEFGQSGNGTRMCIVDPIDGTRSFIAGLPLFGMLLGFLVDEQLKLSVIRMPALDEVYSGGDGLPAACNGAPSWQADARRSTRQVCSSMKATNSPPQNRSVSSAWSAGAYCADWVLIATSMPSWHADLSTRSWTMTCNPKTTYPFLQCSKLQEAS